MNFEKKYREYIELLNIKFGSTHQIVKHSIKVANEVELRCIQLGVATSIVERSVKLALIHDFGKLEWKRNNNLNDFDSVTLAIKQLSTDIKSLPEDINYIVYLLKYFDYKIINNASISSFPFEVLIVAYVDLHVIEAENVSLKERKQYVEKRYFNNTDPSIFKDFWNLRETFVENFRDNFLVNDNSFSSQVHSLSYYTGGWLYDGEYELLLSASRKALKTNKSFVEVGSWRGKSTVLIASILLEAQNKNYLYCIDNWTGGTDVDCLRLAKKYNMKMEFDVNLLPFCKVIKPIVGLSTDNEVIQKISNEIGFIFLDGAHDYDTISMELDIYLPRLISGGIICFHDTDNPRYPDVRKIIDERIVEKLDFIGQSSYLAVYEKR